MSVASTVNRIDYTGNGLASEFDYTFRIFDEDDLRITRRVLATGAEQLLSEGSDYTVSGIGALNGGSIELAAGALPATDSITIRRVRPLKQETDLRNQGQFFAETHEDTFDHLVMIDQQQQDELDRSLKMAETVAGTSFDTELPAELAGASERVIATNVDGDGFTVGPTMSEISSAQAHALAAGASAVEAAQSVVTGHDWATSTADTVTDWATLIDSGEYSAKEYAIGIQRQGLSGGGSSKDWAGLTSGKVNDVEYSAKEYALGTQTRGLSGLGSGKDWANYTGGTVDNLEYSSKEYALGTQIRGIAGRGSSKDWANYTAGTVDNLEFSAKKYAQDAAASAASAASQLASAFFRDVSFKTAANSPITITSTDNGKLFVFDSSAGAITVNLPAISTLTLPFNLAALVDTAGNPITFTRSSTDTLGGATTKVLSVANTGCQLAADTDPSPDKWSVLEFGSVGDATVTDVKLASNSVTTAKILDANVTRAKASTDLLNRAVVSVSAAHPAVDANDIILVNAASGAITVTLPTAIGRTGKIFMIKKTDAGFNVITLATTSSQLIDGFSTRKLATSLEHIRVVSDGTGWQVIDRYIPSMRTAYTPTFNTGTPGTGNTNQAWWSRQGEHMSIKWSYKQTAAGSAGSGNYVISIGGGGALTVDTTKITAPGSRPDTFGSAMAYNGADGFLKSGFVYLPAAPTTTFGIVIGDATSQPTAIGSGFVSLSNTIVDYSAEFRVPITNWEG